MTAVIAEALDSLTIPIKHVKPHPENPRRGDVAGIASSLARFGQVRPILAQKSTGYIVAGNHTYQAALQLAWKKIAVAVVDLSDEDARAYMLADNRWSDVAQNDDAALLAILKDLGEAGQLDGTGYSPDDLDDLLALLDSQTLPPEPTAAEHSETAEETAARVRPALAPMVEVVLLMPLDLKPVFAEQLAALRESYGTTGVTDTIMRCIAEAASAIAPDPPVEAEG